MTLESAEFNERFDLAIDDSADDVWIRRIFDPATIQDCLDGTIDIPNLQYFNDAWWFVEAKHYAPKQLDDLKEWQARAAVAWTTSRACKTSDKRPTPIEPSAA